MFERYTEKARRVVFFARYEASTFGSSYIESEHLLLGLMRENRTLMNRLLTSESVATIHQEIDKNTTVREKLSTSVDLPLSQECKRILAFGAEEAQRLGHKHIGAADLLAGVLREMNCFAAKMLHDRGLLLSAVREELGRDQADAPASQQGAVTLVPQLIKIPAEMQAEMTRQAQARGIDLQKHVLSLLHDALQPHAVEAPKDLMQTFQVLRGRIEAEGSRNLDAQELAEEIARRKGQRTS